MQNIDSLFVLEPLMVIGIAVATLLYWHWRHGLTRDVLGFSLLAYGGAIAIKVAFQYLTAPSFMAAAEGPLWMLGLYLGLQTVIFEVGGAFLVARFAISRRRMKKNDGVGYGLSLAFWENGVLIGATSLMSLLFYFITFSQGGTAADALYTLLSTSHPELFYPPLPALQAISWSLLERISSLMVHLSWGYLCVRAASTDKNRYLLVALPMGMVDFLVPFAQIMTVPIFEIVIFTLAALCILITVYMK